MCGHPSDTSREKKISFAYWFGGFSLITLVSFGLDLFSMASLGQSLVVPLLAGLEVAENQVFAPLVLHAELNAKYDYSAAVVVLLGAVLTSIWGPKGGTTGSSSGAESILTDPCNLTTTTTAAAAAAVAASGSSVVLTEYQLARITFDGLFAESLFVSYEIIVIVLFLICVGIMKVEPDWCKNYLFMAYGYVAGFLGGQQNLFLKGVGTLFGLAFSGSGKEVFSDWYFYIFLLMMLILAPTQLAVINIGLGKFSVLRFVPAYTVLYIIMGTSVGLFFYQEWKQLNEIDWIMFSFGFIFIFASLGILGLKPEQVWTVKVLYQKKMYDVVWYPHLNPEDDVRALVLRAQMFIQLEDPTNSELEQSGTTSVASRKNEQSSHELVVRCKEVSRQRFQIKKLDVNETVVDLVCRLHEMNDEIMELLPNEEEIVLELVKRSGGESDESGESEGGDGKKRRNSLEQSKRARGAWALAGKKVSHQNQVISMIQKKTALKKSVRTSVWNLLTHHQGAEVVQLSEEESGTMQTTKSAPGGRIVSRSSAPILRRSSSVGGTHCFCLFCLFVVLDSCIFYSVTIKMFFFNFFLTFFFFLSFFFSFSLFLLSHST